jgi:hypothetical protein
MIAKNYIETVAGIFSFVSVNINTEIYGIYITVVV